MYLDIFYNYRRKGFLTWIATSVFFQNMWLFRISYWWGGNAKLVFYLSKICISQNNAIKTLQGRLNYQTKNCKVTRTTYLETKLFLISLNSLSFKCCCFIMFFVILYINQTTVRSWEQIFQYCNFIPVYLLQLLLRSWRVFSSSSSSFCSTSWAISLDAFLWSFSSLTLKLRN